MTTLETAIYGSVMMKLPPDVRKIGKKLTADSESVCRGSTPLPPANKFETLDSWSWVSLIV
jgi:hypothetical protein